MSRPTPDIFDLFMQHRAPSPHAIRIRKALLTPDEFRTYLQSLPPDRSFATNSDTSCPIACFNQEAMGDPLGCYSYLVPDGKTTEDAPPEKWATKFAGRVDREPTPTVTVARCLELMENL